MVRSVAEIRRCVQIKTNQNAVRKKHQKRVVMNAVKMAVIQKVDVLGVHPKSLYNVQIIAVKKGKSAVEVIVATTTLKCVQAKS